MDLNQRIDQELEEGQARVSGRFTISLEDMLSKQGRFQGQGQPWWMARFVQAAVASECSSLCVTGSGRLDFETSQRWSVAQLHQALLHPEQPVDRWLEHLRRGLWACGWQDHLDFEVSLAGQEQKIQVKDRQVDLLPCHNERTSICLRTRLNREALLARAHPSTIPIYWNSRPFPGLESLRPLTVASGADLELGVKLSVARGSPHLLHWVEDGVILESEGILSELSDSDLFFWVYLEASGLPRDASGYALVQGPERQERFDRGLRSLVKILGSLTSEPVRAPSYGHPLVRSVQVAGATLGLGWLLGDPGLGTLVACFTGVLAGVFSSDANNFRSGVCSKNREDLLKLNERLKQA